MSFVVIVQNSGGTGQVPNLQSIADNLQVSLSAAAVSMKGLSDTLTPRNDGAANPKVRVFCSKDGKYVANGLQPGQQVIRLPDGRFAIVRGSAIQAQAPLSQSGNVSEVKPLAPYSVAVNGSSVTISGPDGAKAQEIAREISAGQATIATLNGQLVLVYQQPKTLAPGRVNPEPTVEKAPKRKLDDKTEPGPTPKKRGRKPKGKAAEGALPELLAVGTVPSKKGKRAMASADVSEAPKKNSRNLKVVKKAAEDGMAPAPEAPKKRGPKPKVAKNANEGDIVPAAKSPKKRVPTSKVAKPIAKKATPKVQHEKEANKAKASTADAPQKKVPKGAKGNKGTSDLASDDLKSYAAAKDTVLTAAPIEKEAIPGPSCDDTPDDPCPVCYDDPLHPIKLACGHVYCFLCAKGLSESSLSGGGACSMCRRPIEKDFFRHPQIPSVNDKMNDGSTMCWYYEGKNGWWKFDERTNEDIETAYDSGCDHENFLICGNMYTLDFKNMLQLRRDGCGRARRIKRDLSNVVSKGVAGMVTMKM